MQIASELFRQSPALRRLYSALGVISPDDYITLDDALDNESIDATVSIAGVEFNLCDIAESFADDEAAEYTATITRMEGEADVLRAQIDTLRSEVRDAALREQALNARLGSMQAVVGDGEGVTPAMVLRSEGITRQDATYMARAVAYGRATQEGAPATRAAIDDFKWLFQELPTSLNGDTVNAASWGEAAVVDSAAVEVSDFLRGAILAEFSGKLHNPARVAGTYVIIPVAQMRRIVQRTARALRLQQAAAAHAYVQRAALQTRMADVLEAHTQTAPNDVNTAINVSNAVDVALRELGITPKY